MGFDVAFDGENEIQISQYPNPEKQEMMMGGGAEGEGGKGQNVGAGKNDKTKSSSPNKENQSKFDGEPKQSKPSDVGGVGAGDPRGTGGKQMLSNKGMGKEEWNKFIKVLDAQPQKPIKKKYTIKKKGKPDTVVEVEE